MRRCPAMTGSCIRALAGAAPGLTHLDVSDCMSLSDVRAVVSLKRLKVQCGKELQHSVGLQPLTRGNATQALTVSGCPLSPFGLHGIIPRLTTLTSLRLRGVGLLDAAWEGCVGLPRTAYKASRLQVLDVSENPRLSSSVIIPTIDLCPGLRTLMLAGCFRGVTDEVLATAASRCQELRVLSIPRFVCGQSFQLAIPL